MSAVDENLVIITNHCFKRYAQRILIIDEYKDLLEKKYGQQNWLEHVILNDILCSKLAIGKQEKELRSITRTETEKGWIYYNENTGNVFVCSREPPYLVILTCYKYDKFLMNVGKWFYCSKSKNYKNYFQKAKSIMKEYGIKTKRYNQNEIGYLQ